MNQIIDSIFSFVIGGIVMVLLMNQLMSLRTSAGTQSMNTFVHTSLTTANEIMENDFRKIGYSVLKPPADSGIVFAKGDSIVLRGDFNNDGTIDKLTYSLSKNDTGGMNPRTRMLLRTFNGTTQKMKLGITQLNFTYYNTAGAQLTGSPISRPSQISSIKINMKAESTYPSEMSKYDSVYASAAWEKVIKPRNLR